MNVYIMVDLEGISGVFHPDQMSDGIRYEEARRYMTWDINACAEGCKNAGAKKIIVHDAHSGGRNALWHELSPLIDEFIVGQKGRQQRMPCIEECDAIILLGYHAMAGTSNAILEHTWSSADWQNLWINGNPSGEIALDAAIAGEYGKPVIMVSGDDYACAEARDLIPGIVTAEVKKGLSVSGASLLVKEAAHELIRSRASEAVQKADQITPHLLPKPIKIQLELVERRQLPPKHAKPYMNIIDGRTYEVTANSVEEGLFRL